MQGRFVIFVSFVVQTFLLLAGRSLANIPPCRCGARTAPGVAFTPDAKEPRRWIALRPKSWLPAASQALVAAAEKRLLRQQPGRHRGAAECGWLQPMSATWTTDSIGLNAGTT